MILFMFRYFIYVLLSLCFVVYAYMCATMLVIDSLRYSWKKFHSSWVSAGHCHITILHILGSGHDKMLLNNHRSHFTNFIDVFHDLTKSGRDNGIAVNPWLSQQQIVWGIRVNDVACHLESQVPNLASKFDLFHQARTISVKAINGSLSGAQSMGGDAQVLHDLVGRNAQRRPLIDLKAAHLRRSDIPCEIQVSIIFSLDLHII